MAKVFSFMMILAGLEALLQVAGIGFTSTLLTAFNFANPTSWAQGSFILLFISTIVLASVGAITASFFGRSPSESYIITPLISVVGIMFLADMGGIILLVQNTGMIWLTSIIGVITFTISVGFIFSLISWWRGNDI